MYRLSLVKYEPPMLYKLNYKLVIQNNKYIIYLQSKINNKYIHPWFVFNTNVKKYHKKMSFKV